MIFYYFAKYKIYNFMNTIQLFTTILHVIREKTISCFSILNMIVLKHNIVYFNNITSLPEVDDKQHS